MTFSNDCGISYRKDGHPHLSASGVNVEYECQYGVITFRKFPTGIVLLQEGCRRADTNTCFMCPHGPYKVRFDNGSTMQVGRTMTKHFSDRIAAALGLPRKHLGGGDK